MWNFSFELPALLLMVLTLVAFHGTKHLPIRQNRMYLQLVGICFAEAAANILSGWLDDRYRMAWTGGAKLGLELINMAFYMLLLARTLMIFFFYLHSLFPRPNRAARSVGATAFLLAELLVVILSLGGRFHFADESGYQLRTGYYLFAVIQLITCAVMLILLLRFRSRSPERQRRSMLLVIGIETVAALFDLFVPYVLISDMLMALVLLALYLFFMNPAFYVSSRTDAFNLAGLDVFLQSYDPAEYRPVGVTLRNYMTLREIFYPEAVSSSLLQIGTYLNRFHTEDRQNPDSRPGTGRQPVTGSRSGTSGKCCNFYLREGNFLLFLPRDTDTDALVESLRNRFHEAWRHGQTEVFYDTGFVVIGTDRMPRDADSFLSMVRNAMKETARDAVTVIDDKTIGKAERHDAVHHVLDRCVRDNTIQVYLQPLVNAADGSLVGAEALARLKDPDMGVISPGEFIPIAENTGIITELGRQMLEKTCLFLRDNRIPGLRWVNVNVSPAQFVNTQLSEEYGEMVRKTGINPELIHLEITEAAYVTEDALHQRMDAFIRQDFRMALDDFGSGYSNLNRVMDYPFSNIKLDMGFVRTGLAKQGSILGDLIHAFHDMGFSVTAEGIETQEMADRMRDYGCDFFQGYLYSKPLPMDEFIAKYGAGVKD